MNDRDLRGEPCEVHRLFHRRIAAADHRDGLAAEEVAVARRAGGDAVARQLAIGADFQPPRRRARGDDERIGRDRISVAQDES